MIRNIHDAVQLYPNITDALLDIIETNYPPQWYFNMGYDELIITDIQNRQITFAIEELDLNIKAATDQFTSRYRYPSPRAHRLWPDLYTVLRRTIDEQTNFNLNFYHLELERQQNNQTPLDSTDLAKWINHYDFYVTEGEPTFNLSSTGHDMLNEFITYHRDTTLQQFYQWKQREPLLTLLHGFNTAMPPENENYEHWRALHPNPQQFPILDYLNDPMKQREIISYL